MSNSLMNSSPGWRSISPLPRIRLIRYFDLYSSKSNGKWKDWDHVTKLAPSGQKEQNGIEVQDEGKEIIESAGSSEDISANKN